MDIIAQLIKFDKELLLFINSIHNSYFDVFMYTFSKVAVWIPFYASVLFVLYKKWKNKVFWITILLILCVVLCDQITVLMKENIQRFRPSHHPDIESIVHLVKNKRAGLYGFVSSHAANTIGFALISSLIIRRKIYTYAAFTWAVVTCYSRMYLGMHFPLDIIGGAIVGIIIALLLFQFYKRFKLDNQQVEYEKVATIPTITLIITVLAISLHSFWA